MIEISVTQDSTNEVTFYSKDLTHVLCPVPGDRLFQVSSALIQGVGIHLDGNSWPMGAVVIRSHEDPKGGFRSGQIQV